MTVRRIVTGHRDGKSVFLSDERGASTHDYVTVPGFRTTLGWMTPASPQLPFNGTDPITASKSVVPGPAGTVLLLVYVSTGCGHAGAGFRRRCGRCRVCSPGMHTTATIDYDVVLESEIWLELDDGAERKLGQHDVVVQNGTRHAWRNKSDRPATMIFVLVGATATGNSATDGVS